MSQVNLLPPEIRQRAQTRKLTLMVIAAGAVVLVLVLFMFFLQSASLTRVQDQLADQEGRNQTLSGQIAGLQEFATLQTEAQAKQALLQTVFADELSFSGVLLDVSRVIPTDAYLTTFSAQVAAPGGVAAPAATPGATTLVGTISAAGEAAGSDTLSDWITRLEQVKGWVNPWITTYAEGEPGSQHYTFNSGVDLTTDALTKRGRQGAEAAAAGGGVVAP